MTNTEVKIFWSPGASASTFFFADYKPVVDISRTHQDDEEVMENICFLFCELSEYGRLVSLFLNNY